MEEPDVSLGRVLEAGRLFAGFKSGVALPTLEAGLLSVPARVAAGTDDFTGAVFIADFRAVFATGLLFTVVLGALATVFAGGLVVVVLTVLAEAFGSLRVCVFNSEVPAGLDAVPAFVGAAAPTASFFALPTLTLFAADLVTVAFMASSFQRTAQLVRHLRCPLTPAH